MRAPGSEPYDHECEYDEVYYGYQCRECPNFFAFGCAPWEEDEEEFYDEYELLDEDYGY